MVALNCSNAAAGPCDARRNKAQGRAFVPIRRVVALFVVLLGFHMTSPPLLRAEDIIMPGILMRDPSNHCTILRSPINADYLLDNYGTFVLGDSVIVTAGWTYSLDCVHDAPYPCLLANSIAPYRNFDFGCGHLAVDSEYYCGIFHSERYSGIALDSYDGFGRGDSIHVTGDLKFECGAITECFATVCLSSNVTGSCLTANRSTTWGQIRMLFR